MTEGTEYRVDIIEKAYELINLFYEHDFKAYLVGGCVRDLLMSKSITDINDIDITTNAHPYEIEAVAMKHNIKCIETGIKHGTITLIYDNIPMQVTTFRIDKNCDGRHADVEFVKTLKEDLSRRDFTINAIALDRDGYPIDYFCGIKDIMKRRIKAVGNPKERFEEDKLRALRAIRFATTLNFFIEDNTYNAIKEADLSSLSKERIRDELIKIFESPNRNRGFGFLDDTGLLKQIFPEIVTLKGITQDERHHPEKDVFLHTGLALSKLLPNSSLELVLATLLHDIAKSFTRFVKGSKIHFYEHEIVGAELAERILYELKFKTNTIKKVKWLVENHMRVHHFSEMKKSKKIKLVEHECFDDLLQLLRVDILGSSGINNTHEDLTELATISEFLIEYEKEMRERPVLKEKLINGYDVIKSGVSPKQGILIGQILEKVNDEIVEGKINTRDEALNYIQKLIKVNNRYGVLEE